MLTQSRGDAEKKEKKWCSRLSSAGPTTRRGATSTEYLCGVRLVRIEGMKPIVYIETRVASYYHSAREALKHDILRTRQWWDNEREG